MSNYTVDVTGGINFNINNGELKIEDTDPIYVNTKGDLMHGDLNMNNHFIKNVGDPKEDNDVVTKKYFDNNIPRTSRITSETKYKLFKFPQEIEEYKLFVIQKDILILEEHLQTKYETDYSIRIDPWKKQSQSFLDILKNKPNLFTLNYSEEKKKKPNGVFTLDIYNQTGKLIIIYIRNDEIEKPGFFDKKMKKIFT